MKTHSVSLRVVSLCVALLSAGPAFAQNVLITNANVIDGLSPAIQPNVSILIADGKIAQIGQFKVELSTGTTVIDAKGRYVLPGLIDAHTHLASLDAAKRALESGATTVRTAGVGGYNDIAIRDMVRARVLAGPDILATGVFVTPSIEDAVLADPRLVKFHKTGVRTIDELRELVRINLAHGVDWMKTRGTERAGRPETDPREQVYSEVELRAIVEEAAKGGVKILAHAHGEEGIRAAVLAGVASIEHGTYASDQTLQLMKERGTFLVPTLSSISSFGQPGDYANPALFLRGQYMAPRRMDSVKRAYALGIPIVAGVDTNYEPQSTARITREIGLLVDAGLTPWDAIRGATTVAAHHLGIEGKTGALKVGLEGDLIVIESNPLEDIVRLQDILVVVSNGMVGLNRLPKIRDDYR